MQLNTAPNRSPASSERTSVDEGRAARGAAHEVVHKRVLKIAVPHAGPAWASAEGGGRSKPAAAAARRTVAGGTLVAPGSRGALGCTHSLLSWASSFVPWTPESEVFRAEAPAVSRLFSILSIRLGWRLQMAQNGQSTCHEPHETLLVQA